ncbi:NifU family protein [thermophilic bacterium 2918]|uniref:NifU family protein n=1 Tax=Thermogemmata fonticola TaxID=2755323 RepID=A0A7V8VCK9_9BACT|nr:NifU family protein [Thermogemmata fonticola]
MRERVEQTLRQELLPGLGEGMDIEVVDVSNGVVQVRFPAACTHCPGSILTIVTLLEDELRKKIPEVEVLEVVA